MSRINKVVNQMNSHEIIDPNGKIIAIDNLPLALLQADETAIANIPTPPFAHLMKGSKLIGKTFIKNCLPCKVREKTRFNNNTKNSIMKTFIYFIGTCFISTGALLGALNAKNPFPAFAVAFGIWALFFWGWNKRLKEAEERRNRERLLDEYLRMMLRERMH